MPMSKQLRFLFSSTFLLEVLQIALSHGGDWAEIFFEKRTSTSISLENNQIEKIRNGSEQGFHFRLIFQDKHFSTYSNSLDESTLRHAASILANSMMLPLTQVMPFSTILDQPSMGSMIDPQTVSLIDKMALVTRANESARHVSLLIHQVSVGYADTVQDVLIVNSQGTFSADQRIRTRLSVNCIASQDDRTETGFESAGIFGGIELFDKTTPESIGEIAGKRALIQLNAYPAPRGKMMVVLSGEAGGTMIHEACGHALEADFIYKETSIFKGKMGQKIASELITVIDEGNRLGHFGYQCIDDEGTLTQKTVLIENGVLKKWLSDCQHAHLLGLKSTGNGRRESYKNNAIPRMTNTYIAAGKDNPADIILSVDHGVFVKKMGGGQVNITNGDFVFEITEGYLIEHGKVTTPIRGATLTGNGPEILKIIDRVGNDVHFIPGVCGKYDHAPVSDGQPTLRIPEIVIGGTE